LGVLVGLGDGVGAIQEVSYDLLEELLADVHGAVDTIAGLHPVHFTNGDLPSQRFSTVTELDVEEIPAEDYGHAVKGVAVPRCGFSRSQALAPDQNFSAMV
jgi:hypothetical protein